VFGDKGEKGWENQAAHAAALAEVERLEALPLMQLAGEIMTRGFGPGGPGASRPGVVYGRKVISVYAIARTFDPDPLRDRELEERLNVLIAEGVQALEHGALVFLSSADQGLDRSQYALTRLGRSALQNNAVERVLRGNSLDDT
jgi:hypothetical protein